MIRWALSEAVRSAIAVVAFPVPFADADRTPLPDNAVTARLLNWNGTDRGTSRGTRGTAGTQAPTIDGR
jgi:hypothetical protein